MNLTSHFFIFYFFPITISIYYALKKYNFVRDSFIIVCSLVFYVSFGFDNLPILLIPLIFDYLLALYLYSSTNAKIKKIFLFLGITINLGILGYFKYAGFLESNFATFLNIRHLFPNVENIILPVGISFITFQRISYIIDSYRKKIKPTKNLLSYSVYATLFPHLISGPIVRFSQISYDLKNRLINSDTIFEGVKFFTFGFAFKILIANGLYSTEEIIVKNINSITTFESIVFVIYFTFRLYIDFLGYSFMAIGLAKLLGFNFPRNFNSPYKSSSITDFWRRWNITLSLWLRDYLYIPLGGNRKGNLRTYFNLFFTMLAAGLWHGANWSFVMWGGIHGFFLTFERFLSNNHYKINLPIFLRRLLTIVIVSLAWIPFKFVNLSETLLVIKSFFKITVKLPESNLLLAIDQSLLPLFIAVCISLIIGDGFVDKIRPSLKSSIIISILLVFTIFVSLIRKEVPFIYFQF